VHLYTATIRPEVPSRKGKNCDRRHTKGLALQDDDWLSQERPFWENLPANHYFMWFHALEDEVNHRGQIRWLRKRLPSPEERDRTGPGARRIAPSPSRGARMAPPRFAVSAPSLPLGRSGSNRGPPAPKARPKGCESRQEIV
jgi:hypothetical protein